MSPTSRHRRRAVSVPTSTRTSRAGGRASSSRWAWRWRQAASPRSCSPACRTRPSTRSRSTSCSARKPSSSAAPCGPRACSSTAPSRSATSRASTASSSRRTASRCPSGSPSASSPDTFRDVPDLDVSGVTAEGELQADNTLQPVASNILAKCPQQVRDAAEEAERRADAARAARRRPLISSPRAGLAPWKRPVGCRGSRRGQAGPASLRAAIRTSGGCARGSRTRRCGVPVRYQHARSSPRGHVGSLSIARFVVVAGASAWIAIAQDARVGSTAALSSDGRCPMAEPGTLVTLPRRARGDPAFDQACSRRSRPPPEDLHRGRHRSRPAPRPVVADAGPRRAPSRRLRPRARGPRGGRAVAHVARAGRSCAR